MSRSEQLIRRVEDGLKSGELVFDERQMALFTKLKGTGIVGAEPAPFNPQAESERAKELSGGFLKNVGPINVGRGVSPQFHEATQSAVQEFDRRRQTAQSGVTLNEPLPASSTGVGFSDDPQVAVQKILTDEFRSSGVLGKDEQATVRTGPVSGQLEFFDPKSKKYKIVNLDIKSKAGFALPAAGDVIGSVAGTVAGARMRNPVAGGLTGETIGSTGGTTVGEMLRLAIGSRLGYNELSTKEIVTKALKEGGKAGAITLGVGTTVVGVKALKNFLEGNVFTKQAAMDAGFSTEEADEITRLINEINEEVGSTERLKLTTAKRAQAPGQDTEPVMGALEADLRRKQDFVQRFRDRDASDSAAVTGAFDATQSPYEQGDQFVGQQLSPTQIQQQIADPAEKRIAQAKNIVRTNVDELEASLNSFDSIVPQAGGGVIRPVLKAKSEAAQNEVNRLNDAWRNLTDYTKDSGVTGVRLELDNDVINLKKALSRESREAITNITKQSKSKIFGTLEEANNAQRSENYLANWLGESPRDIEIGKDFDLIDFNISLSDMKRAVRTSSRNGNLTDPAIGDMKRAIRVLEKNRNEALDRLGRTDLKEAILEAEAERAKVGQVYERSIIGSVLETEGAGFKVKSSKVVQELLNNPDDMQTVLGVIGDNPEAMQAMRRSIAGLYKKSVAPTGIPKLNKHKEFIEGNRQALELLFPGQLDEINKLGVMGEVVAKQEKQMKDILRGSKRFGRTQLTSMDPEKMIDWVTSDAQTKGLVKPSGVEVIQMPAGKVKYIKNILSARPAAWRGFQDLVAKRIRMDVMKDGWIDGNSLDVMLKNPAALEEIFGKKYVSNLRVISSAEKLASKQFKHLSGNDKSDAIKQAIRGTDFAAPLSQRGRRFTAMLLMMRKVNHERIAQALLEPGKLNDMANIARHDNVTRTMLELAGSVGLIIESAEPENIETNQIAAEIN